MSPVMSRHVAVPDGESTDDRESCRIGDGSIFPEKKK